MRITSKGQFTIPQAIREQAGLMPGAEVEFEVERDGTIRIGLANNPTGATRGQRIVARLRGAGDIRMTTDEIMALTRGEGRRQGRQHERRPRR
jgi:AbrB family looped-hinge helix DNA binding protein